jgi:ketosteroid isomerase-like protein
MSNAERLMEALARAFSGDESEMDAALVERMISALAPIATDDVVMVMAGPDDSFVATYTGPDGLREGWADWLGSFERVRFQFEGIEELGGNVLTLGRQIGTAQGVEVEQPSAAVWKFRDGRLARVEFHLDRGKAHASAQEPL